MKFLFVAALLSLPLHADQPEIPNPTMIHLALDTKATPKDPVNGHANCKKGILYFPKDDIWSSTIDELFRGAERKIRIQDLESWTSGAPGDRRYRGKYFERVYLIHTNSEHYKHGIWERVRLIHYYETGALSVEISLLNHNYSAELNEGRCDNAHYFTAN